MADVLHQKEGTTDFLDMGDALASKEKDPSIEDLEDDIENSPILEVRATVPPTDDPTLPTKTFRAWSLGIFFTALLAFVNQFFWFRDNPLTIRVMVAQLLTYPLGKIMARVLPTHKFSLFGKEFSLNPGPFNIKEHVLITVMANTGATTFAAIDIIVIQKLYYNDSWGFGGGLLLVISTQFVGYGLAGALRRFLVRPASMVWPVNLVNVSLFHTFHRHNTANGVLRMNDKEEATSWKISRNMFFFLVSIASFVYYWLPGYIFPLLTSISWICWINRDSLLINQLGSGLKGIGYLSFTLDWSSMAAWLPSPLAVPWWAQANMLAGFVFFVWILIPIMYYTNSYDGKLFPIYNTKTYDQTGQPYNLSRVLVNNTLDEQKYSEYSPVRITAFFATMYGQGLCALGAIVSHAALYHGKDIWNRVRSAKQKEEDIHARLMDANYPEAPDAWYIATFVIALGLSILTVEIYPSSDMSWWHIIVAMCLAAVWVLPVGILTAITSQAPTISMITEWVFGAMEPGKPIGNMIFKTYGYITVQQAILFTQDLKLGHYMKIPPRDMFIFQMVGTMAAALVSMGTTSYLMGNIKDICTDAAYPFTCPSASIFGASSVVWGVVGPKKFLSTSSLYHPIVWFFFIGFLLPVPFYFLARKYPNSWVKDINMAAFMLGGGPFPPAGASIMTTWALIGFIFNFVIKRKHFGWWSKYNYVMSAALDAGIAVSALVIFFALQNNNIKMPTWWGNSSSIDQCPLVTQNWAGHDTYAEQASGI
ncbi:hypothetical protein BGZ76_008988 [Entomortierella beljakovae]|nr:hypothetical protein BGZ76_008988 [Entomortierella beljakovae]